MQHAKPRNSKLFIIFKSTILKYKTHFWTSLSLFCPLWFPEFDYTLQFYIFSHMKQFLFPLRWTISFYTSTVVAMYPWALYIFVCFLKNYVSRIPLFCWWLDSLCFHRSSYPMMDVDLGCSFQGRHGPFPKRPRDRILLVHFSTDRHVGVNFLATLMLGSAGNTLPRVSCRAHCKCFSWAHVGLRGQVCMCH